MTTLNSLVPLEIELHINKALIMGITQKIHVYIIDKSDSYPRLLSPAHLSDIRQAKPSLAKITFERPQQNTLTKEWNHSGKFGDYGHLDLWVTQNTFNEHFYELSDLSAHAETTYLNIIGLLIHTMLSRSTGGQKISCSDTQSTIIDYLTTNFPRIKGISKTTLQDKFSKANKLIEDKLPETPAGA